MRCLRPRTVGFEHDGKTICWSPKRYSKQYATLQLPCSKCIECRLEYARQWAVRCVHEAKMYENNSFITLTYSDENLVSDKLYYADFQNFLKRLRDHSYRKFLDEFGRENWKLLSKEERKAFYDRFSVGVFVTGEYGDRTKRPHWHACLFNWSPGDLEYKYTSDRGDRVYSSETLDRLWGKGITELGSVTFESAGYCARYAAKKLVHGDDGHRYEPISKKSSRYAIGKKWLERYWRDVFNYGYVVLDNGTRVSIPRYYEKWLKKEHPDDWIRYVTETKASWMMEASSEDKLKRLNRDKINWERLDHGKGLLISENKVREIVSNDRFKRLQQFLKGDI